VFPNFIAVCKCIFITSYLSPSSRACVCDCVIHDHNRCYSGAVTCMQLRVQTPPCFDRVNGLEHIMVLQCYRQHSQVVPFNHTYELNQEIRFCAELESRAMSSSNTGSRSFKRREKRPDLKQESENISTRSNMKPATRSYALCRGNEPRKL
jgi:hypothetical protein